MSKTIYTMVSNLPGDETMYMTTIQAAEKWGVTRGRVCHYLWGNQIPGAIKVGRDWLIPEECQKPLGYQPNKTGPKGPKAAQQPQPDPQPTQSSPVTQSSPKIGSSINIVPR